MKDIKNIYLNDNRDKNKMNLINKYKMIRYKDN